MELQNSCFPEKVTIKSFVDVNIVNLIVSIIVFQVIWQR